MGRRKPARNFDGYDVNFLGDGSAFATKFGPDTFDGGHFPDEIRGRAISPAPFVLIWKWEDKPDFGRSTNKPSYYLWFLGYRRPLNQESIPPKFVHWHGTIF